MASNNNTDSNDSINRPSTSTASSSGSIPVRQTRGGRVTKISYRENSNEETSDEDEILRKKSVVNGHVRVINPTIPPPPPAAKTVNETRNKRDDSSSDESEESSSESSEYESQDDHVPKAPRNAITHATRNSKPPDDSHRTKSPPSTIVLRVRKRPLTAESESESSDGYVPSISTKISRSSRPRRAIKRMNYSHNSEEEATPETPQPPPRQRRASAPKTKEENSANSESGSESDPTPKISISSRGRVRKLMPHVRAFLRE